MRKNYRILSAILCIALLIPLFATTAFAAVSAKSKAVPSAPIELDALSNYLHASVSVEDNTSHLPVNIHTYYDSERKYVPSTIGVAGTVSILYVMNTNTERLGQKSDEELVKSFIERGYFVVVLDYKNNPAACGTALDWSVQDIRCQVIGGNPFAGGRAYTSGTYTDGKLVGTDPICAQSYILPAGYDIAYNIPYFSYDKHGVAGTFECIVEIWNNDFKSVKRNTIVKWVDENGSPRLNLTEAITEKALNDNSSIDYATWFKTADGKEKISQSELEKLSDTEQKNYPYTYIGNTIVKEVTDCVQPDGTMIDLNLYFDILYPSDYDDQLPAMIAMSSNYTRTTSWTAETRPYLNGPLFNGYVGIVSDYGLVPMCRNDHYGYFCGDSQLNSISGDNGTYSLSYYNGIHSDTALLRTIRKIGVDGMFIDGYGEVEAPINPEKIGAYGNSKAGVIIRLANPTPEKLNELRSFEGHNGETRLEVIGGNYPYVDPYVQDGNTMDARIDMPEIQPALKYDNGETIHSGLNFVFANCGGASNTLTEGSAPIFGVGTQSGKAEGSYYTYYATTANLARNLDIPFFGLVAPTIAHDLGYGLDKDYGIDILDAFNRYADYWLKDESVECIIVDVDTTQDICVASDVEMDNVYEITDDSSIKLQFTGPISESEINKVKILSLSDGGQLNGDWHGSYGNQQWMFIPYDIKDATYYTIVVPDDLCAENGKYINAPLTHTFRTTLGITENALSVDSLLVAYDCVNAGPGTSAAGYTLDQSTYKFYTWVKNEGLQIDLRAIKSGVAPNPNARINIFDEIWKDPSYVGKTIRFTFSAKASEEGTIGLTLNQRQKYAFANFPGLSETADLTTSWRTFCYEFTVTQQMYDVITNGSDPNGIEATGLALGVRFTDFSDDGASYNPVQIMFRDFNIYAPDAARSLSDSDPIFFTFSEKDYSTAHDITLRFAVTNDAVNTVGIYEAGGYTIGKKLGEVIVTGAGLYNFDVTDYVKINDGSPVVAVKIEESVGSTVINSYDYENGSTGINFNATITESIISDKAPNADGSVNMSEKLEYAVRSAYYIDLNQDLVSKYTASLFNFASSSSGIKAGAFNESDYGRRFRVTFRIYDETSRVVNVYNGNGYDASFSKADFKNTNYSFYTTAGEWTTVTVEFTVDDDIYFGDALRKQVLLFDAENKSIAVLDKHSAVNVRNMAAATVKPGNYAGKPGLSNAYTAYSNVDQLISAGKVTYYDDLSYGLYVDDIIFEEIITTVHLASTAPMLSITPTSSEEILPTVSASVVSTSPNEPQEGLWIGGGKNGFDTKSVKSYVKLSLDGYYGGFAGFVFKAVGVGDANIFVYGVADVNSGQNWSSETITSVNAPENDIYGSGVNLNAVYGGSPLNTFKTGVTESTCVVDLSEFAESMLTKGAKEITLVLVSDANTVTNIQIVGDEIVTKIDEFDCINRGPTTGAAGYTLDQTTYKFFSWTKDNGLQIDTRSISGALNANQNARISIFDAIWKDPSYVGKTIRFSFDAKASEAGSLGLTLNQRQKYAFNNFAGFSGVADLTADWQTFTFEFTVTQAMYDCITNGDDPNGIEATGLALGIRFNDYGDGNGKYRAAQFFFRDFVIHEVSEPVGADKFYIAYDFVSNKPVFDTRGYGKQLATVVDGELQIDLTKDSQAPNPNGYTRVVALDQILSDASSRGKVFTITFRARSTEDGVMDFAFNKFGSFNTYSFGGTTYKAQYALTTRYQKFTYTFKVTDDMISTHASTNLNLAFRLYNGFLDGSAYKAAQVYIDDITIVENPYVPSADYTYDMESNKPTFDTRGYGKQLATIINGEMQIDLTKDSQAPNKNAYTRVEALNQIFTDTTNIGKTFTISFRAKATEVGLIDLAFNKYGSFNTYTYGGKTYNAQYTLTTDYQTFTYTFTVVDDMFTTHASTPINLALRLYNGFLASSTAYKSAQVYIDDIRVCEEFSVNNSTIPVLDSQAVSASGNSDNLSVYADDSASGTPKIQKSYFSYDLTDVFVAYGAKLSINLLNAKEETVRVYILADVELPEPLTYENAPVSAGLAATSFVAINGMNYVDLTEVVKENAGKSIVLILAIEEPSDAVLITDTPKLEIVKDYHDYTSELQRHPVVAPTHTSPGHVEFYTCLGCDKLYIKNYEGFIEVTIEDVIIPTLKKCEEHTFVDGICTVCGEHECTGGIPTCQSKAKCSICGKEYGEFGNHIEETRTGKAPTCTEAGLTDGKKCTVCDKVTVEQEAIPALGHIESAPVKENSVSPDCTKEGGYDTVVYCSRCNAELSRVHTDVVALGHNYESIVHAPSCSEAGYTAYTCLKCGDVYLGDEVDPIEHSWVAATTEAPKTCEKCGATEGEKLPVVDDELVDPDTSIDVDHYNCEANVFQRIINAIINFFRKLFGLPEKCYCGDDL